MFNSMKCTFFSATADEEDDDDEEETDESETDADDVDDVMDAEKQTDDGVGLKSLMEDDANKQSQVMKLLSI